MSLSSYPSNSPSPENSFVVSTPSPQPSAHGSGDASSDSFVDRRTLAANVPGRSERRQFGSSHAGLTDDGRELALAIDQYKIEHHRRYLTCDEMLDVMTSLGYSKS
ncbi:hypothetical protein [Rubripirellula reticaptiva]|uniref:Uncharacterized protein n=1 Tax=Rubripirellula reticaptiva TaxID=2528013 RepID=A0A5C6F6T6_9BACT|nr:hypothetical protein [Rubripirellula reticaptiva]TWU57413.1 hypothetical protein Poly59_03200 [Rubripirellula reticaptiva]